ncbi:bifunctional phosphoribosylaminoimidazolecarboxamide formyltransferase/IMP cyclohydrolase [bacterium]|nr:bifunctional phosphoribosylaminoimidazolecarboxamide formyltransferase/IMP cyclohydrolase [bacterium]NIN91664.1 bifunctional phosphoribosylaminoimidazolecarboxamide formyltransferase/IMP cyclohydrolase [bacterium]NIO18015.1 bifunctional phosphoribosylaminoimidazolecarboxamide formyltransferase/IMP cyclohydrolase [bacterium]NIO72979.1 bifunctional phosphoribosylaminoimidazolecarboxamide formyltransferase/IMP cyclohydrolase [bacterium]
MPQVNRALISVFDKTGIVEFARGLKDLGVEIISTGGTAKMLKESGIPIRSVSDYTGFPEVLEGRVKTLHPKVHGALLAVRDNPQHMKEIQKHNIELIDMVVINLYPFEATVAKEGVTKEEAIENIDIGGPTMLRSAAKNYKWVVPISNPANYTSVLEEMKKNKGAVSEETSLRLTTDIFQHLSRYNYHIYHYFLTSSSSASLFPDLLQLQLEKVKDLRYGENPHQSAAFYKELVKGKEQGIAGIEQLGGKELSFNNILDLDAAVNIVKEFEEPVAVIIKHTNPCGVATSEALLEAYNKARQCDPVSAFGSIVGFNRKVDSKTAEEIVKTFVEAVIGPDFEDEAVKVLKTKKDIRLLKLSGERKLSSNQLDYRRVSGGLLVQTKDLKTFADGLEVVTEKKPNDVELKALRFAWKVCKHVKSNAIVLASESQTLGIGAGQMSRVDAVKIASRKMGEQFGKYKGLIVMASDAFFPFRDSVDLASTFGVTAIIQPGGSLRDKESIAACNEHKIAMAFTRMRHFRH